jgi:hypothetical protein
MQNGEFRIRFMSGDVTEGLTVEFFDNGVFLFFGAYREICQGFGSGRRAGPD